MSNKFWHGLSETLLWWRPAKEGEEKSRYMAIYMRLLGYARPYVFPDLALSVLAMLALSAANGAIPYLLKETINSLSMIKADNPHNLARLHMLSLGILVVFVVRALTDFVASFLTDYIGMKTAMDLRAEFNDRLQRLPLSFFNWTPTGNLLTRALSDVQMASSIITNSLISLVGDSLTLVALVGGLFWMDFRFALLAFVVFPVAILPIIGAARRVRKTAKSAQRKLSDISVLMQEAVQGCRVVKAFGMEDYESERFRAMLKKQLRMMRRVLRASAFSSPFIEVLGACAVVAVLWYGISAVLDGSRSPGTFAAFIGAMLIIYRPFKRIAGTNNSIQQGLVSAERVFAIIDHPPEVYEAPGALELKHGPHSIEFRKVNFRYDPNGEWVLRNINMKVGAGETVALVGMSGGGKSTLSDLIPRFYDPNKGEMLIDGVDAKRYTLKSLRAEIGLVSQHTFLFNDTIRTNIAYGGGSGDFDEIVAARQGRQRPRLHHPPAQRLRHSGRRAGGAAFGRRAPAAGDRAGAAQKCADPDPRRADLQPRLRGRARGAGRNRTADDQSHHPDDRAPAFHRAPRRPHLRDRERRDRRGGHARRAAGARRRVSQALRSAVLHA